MTQTGDATQLLQAFKAEIAAECVTGNELFALAFAFIMAFLVIGLFHFLVDHGSDRVNKQKLWELEKRIKELEERVKP